MTLRLITDLDIDECFNYLIISVKRDRKLMLRDSSTAVTHPHRLPENINLQQEDYFFQLQMVNTGTPVSTIFMGKLRSFSGGTKIMIEAHIKNGISLKLNFVFSASFFLIFVVFGLIRWNFLLLMSGAVMFILFVISRRGSRRIFQNNQKYLVRFLVANLGASQLEMGGLSLVGAETVQGYAAVRAMEREQESMQEAYVFYQSLGPEVGPESCQRSNCQRLTIQHSRFCQFHRFENLRGKEGVRLLKAAEFFWMTDKISIYE